MVSEKRGEGDSDSKGVGKGGQTEGGIGGGHKTVSADRPGRGEGGAVRNWVCDQNQTGLAPGQEDRTPYSRASYPELM